MAGGNNGDKTLTPTTLTNVRLAALVSHYFALSDWSFSRERSMGIRPAPSPGAKQAIGLSFNCLRSLLPWSLSSLAPHHYRYAADSAGPFGSSRGRRFSGRREISAFRAPYYGSVKP